MLTIETLNERATIPSPRKELRVSLQITPLDYDYIVAGMPTAPVSELEDLSECPRSRIRARVAENLVCPLDILIKLAFDECADVRIAVSDNPRSPSYLLEYLANDNNADVRFAMAENCHVPAGILQKLTCDQNPYVSCRAEQTISRMKACGMVVSSIEEL